MRWKKSYDQLNVAVTLEFSVTVIVQDPVVVQRVVLVDTLQLLNVEFVPGVAVSVTEAPLGMLAVQVPVWVPFVLLQFSTPKLSDTVPMPDPDKVTVKLNSRVARARKISGRPFESRATRSFAEEMKLTTVPSPLSDGAMLLPLAGGGDEPAATLASTMPAVHGVVLVVVDTVRQLLRT